MDKEKSPKPKAKPSAGVRLNKFLQEDGMIISPAPRFVKRDDGTFSLVVGINAEDKQ